MRELTNHEVQAVSGAGLINDTTTWLGYELGGFIGGTLGSLVPIPVLSGVVAKFTSLVGKKIGSWLGNALGSLVESFFTTDSSTTA